LQNAGSIASLMLTTEALVAEIPEEKKAPAAADTAAVDGRHVLRNRFQLSAVSYQLQHNLGPAQRSGAFFFWVSFIPHCTTRVKVVLWVGSAAMVMV
jgi:hypothetical protein